METCDPIGTPMEIKDKLDLDQNGTLVDATKYCSMIGALMYLTSSRLDIVHATCLCARYQAKPTEKHLKEVKRIFRYLRGTVNMGLCTSGGTQFLGEKLVSWSWKKQDCMALSTAEAEYTLSACCAQVIWMRTQLTDYGFHFNKILIYCDSKSAIAISCNPVQHLRTKHIAVHYHFIKEHLEKGTIELYFVKTDYQLADLFTKALLVDRFTTWIVDGVAASFQEEVRFIITTLIYSSILNVNRFNIRIVDSKLRVIIEPQSQLKNRILRAQDDKGSQIKMILCQEILQVNDLMNSKSKRDGSYISRSQSMNEQSCYKQDKTKTRQSINIKSHIFNVKGDNDKSKQTPTRMSSVSDTLRTLSDEWKSFQGQNQKVYSRGSIGTRCNGYIGGFDLDVMH
ncbi:hypothetical protein Tco_0823733 [Tanacetum coccineum]|uniref:Retrovirus-related Pol polyprotein from transposon TNT 1-94 n=1 Tax=Tanacetum coccineum TaxID=301880 RepID=A0ABQ5AND1_9ASTR